MADNYKNKIKNAAWSLLESRFCPYHTKSRKKQKWIGRLLKRGAKQMDIKEIKEDLE